MQRPEGCKPLTVPNLGVVATAVTAVAVLDLAERGSI